MTNIIATNGEQVEKKAGMNEEEMIIKESMLEKRNDFLSEHNEVQEMMTYDIALAQSTREKGYVDVDKIKPYVNTARS